MAARVLPRFRHFGRFDLEFSLALTGIFPFVLIGCCDFSFGFTTLKALFGAISNHVATNKRKPEVYVYHDYSMEEENIYVK